MIARHASHGILVALMCFCCCPSSAPSCCVDQLRSLGSAVASGADLDGDGKSDLLIGAPKADIGTAQKAGSVVVVSSASGKRLVSIDGREPNEHLGSATAFIADVNDDKYPDIVVGAPMATRRSSGSSEQVEEHAGRVTIYSGKNGEDLRTLWGSAHEHFGTSLAVIGDLDKDGTPDLLVGAPSSRPSGLEDAGIARVLSGRSGDILLKVEGARAGLRLGESVGSLPDLNRDGVPDFAVGGPSDSTDGEIRICSGKDASNLRVLKSQEGWKWFGKSLALMSSAVPEPAPALAISAPGSRWEGKVGVGMVAIFTLNDVGVPRSFGGTSAGEGFGAGVVSPGDLNGDGVADLCVGAPRATVGAMKTAGVVRAISGADGTHLWTVSGDSAGALLGTALTVTDDLDGDKKLDVVIGSPGKGEVRVASGGTGADLLVVEEGKR